MADRIPKSATKGLRKLVGPCCCSRFKEVKEMADRIPKPATKGLRKLVAPAAAAVPGLGR